MESIEKALRIGVVLDGRYRIERVLGEGGFGITYLATDTLLNCEVAIKEFLPVELAARTGDSITVQPRTNLEEDYHFGLERYLQEARVLAKFQHSNIVHINNFIQANGTAYLVMDYAEGQPLYEWLKAHQTLNEDIILKIIIPILEGLTEVHKTGLLHRDIKPGNIFMRKQGGPMLIDFGSARHALGEHSKSISAIISQGYAPPEQYTSRGKQGPFTDLYAIGAVLYELITGEAPIESVDRSHDIMGGEPDPLVPAVRSGQGKVGDWLLQLVDQLLQVNGKDRPQNCAEVLQAIRNKSTVGAASAANSEPPNTKADNHTRVVRDGDRFTASAPISQPAAPPAGQARTGNKGVMAAIAVLVVIIAVGIWWATSPQTADLQHADADSSNAENPYDELITGSDGGLVKGRAILYVESEPPGAEVYLDDVLLGTTPYSGDALPAGAHKLKLVHELFMDAQADVVLADDEVVKQRLQLKPAAGGLTVFSEPAGATIHIDGESTGKQTPATLKGLIAGNHELKLHKDTYYDSTSSVRIIKAQTIRQDIKLKGGDLVAYKGKWMTTGEKSKHEAEERVAAAAKKAAEDKRQAVKYRKQAQQQARAGDLTATKKLLNKAARLVKDAAQDGRILSQAKQQQQQRIRAIAGKLIRVPSGSYRMGSNSGDADEMPVHSVRIKAFQLGETEVTQAQWRAVMGSNPSKFKCDNCPVEKVSWDDIQGYLKKLNSKTGQRFRLPTESEWEYACRSGGKEEKYCGGDTVDSIAWYRDNSGSKTHPVKQKSANGLGLYDMSGNVWEWTGDCWNENYRGAPANGSSWTSGDCERRVLRGGGWNAKPAWVRSANRIWLGAASRYINYGFRLAQDL